MTARTSLQARIAAWPGSSDVDVQPGGDGSVGISIAGDAGRLDGWIEAAEDPERVVVRLAGPWEVPADRFGQAAGVVARINCALDIGNVELSSTGDWRARAGLALGGAAVDDEALGRLLDALVDACHGALLLARAPLAAVIDGDDPGPLP